MLKNKLILACIACLFFCQLKAEKTAGIATLYAEADLSNLLELQTNTSFYSHPFSPRHEKVLLVCIVKNKQLVDGLTLKKNTLLFDFSFRKIGKSLQELIPLNGMAFNDSCTKIFIVALIDKAAIDPLSVPELALTNMMKFARNNEKVNFFEKYFKEFGFEQQDTCLGYVPFVTKQYDFIQNCFTIRLQLVFLHQELIAIFYKRPLSIPVYDAKEYSSEFGMIYNAKFSEHDKLNLMEVFHSGIKKVN